MPPIRRTFRIPVNDSETVDITLYEPSLTADNLGFKTWASSYLLAKRLKDIHLPPWQSQRRRRALELGAGTGLVGIAAAAVLGAEVHLTDLAAITDNLSLNVKANEKVIQRSGGAATTGVLDWEDEQESKPDSERYDIILSADPLYSPQHPRMIVNVIKTWLSEHEDARCIVELPLREAYIQEIENFKAMMAQSGFVMVAQEEEVGYDDWSNAEGDGSTEVCCSWAMWASRRTV